MAKPLRIFVSSPGDVDGERRRAGIVIAELRKAYARFFDIEPILWEWEPMLASGHFQDQITPPSETDIVIVIVWSRLGTALPPKTQTREYRGIDGRVPVTGTEWEFEDALAAQKQRGAPDLLAYRKQADHLVSLRDRAARIAAEEQWDKLEAFWSRWFVDRGQFRAAFGEFADLDGFEAKLRSDLRTLIERRIKNRVEDGAAAPTWLAGSPFRGLDAYRFEHASIFFGRNAMTKAAVEQITTGAQDGRGFLLVLGASGSGKSSLVQAGVVPALAEPGIVTTVGLWRRAVMRPGGHAEGPFAGLAEALAGKDALPELLAGRQDALSLARHLKGSVDDPAFSIVAALNDIEDAARARGRLTAIEKACLVLVVDQLEELFTASGVATQERAAFIRCLNGLAKSGRVYVLATMRSDYWHRAAETPLLVKMAAASGRLDLLPAVQDEIIEMIRQPAEAAGISFEVDPSRGIGLDAMLAREAADEPGALPLLSFLLNELYRRDVRDGRVMLTRASMRELGGLRGAIANRAEATFTALPNDVQAALPRVLRAIVRVSRSATEPAARAITLAQFANQSPERTLIEALLAPQVRLLVADGDGAGARVRLAHEALLTHWERARQRIVQDREDLRTRAIIEEALAEYRQAPRRIKRKYLLRDPQLASAIDISTRWNDEFGPETVAFVQASRRRARRVQMAGWGLASLLFLLTIAAGIAAKLADQATARANSELAEAQTTQSRFLANLARQQRDHGDAGTAFLLALAALPGGDSDIPRPLIAQAELQRDYAAHDLHERVVLAGHSGNIKSAAVSPDGRIFVTGSDDHTIQRWDARTGRQIGAPLAGHDGSINALAFSPDGKRIISASSDKTVRLWDAERGQQIGVFLIGHRDAVNSVSFSPDGKRIITASSDKTVRIWDATSGQQLGGPLIESEKPMHTAEFSPDGKRIVTAELEGAVRIWDSETRQPIGPLLGGPTLRLNTAAFSPDGRGIVTTSYDGTETGGTEAYIWSAETGERILEIEKPADAAYGWAARFSPDGKSIAMACADNSVRIFDAKTGKQLMTPFMGHTNDVLGVIYSPAGDQILSTSSDGTARLWNVSPSNELDQDSVMLAGAADRVSAAAFSPDGRRVITGVGSAARLWDVSTGQPVALPFDGHAGQVMSAGFSHDGKLIVTAGWDHTARIWDPQTGRQIGEALIGHASFIFSAEFSPDDKQIVTASDDGTVRIWDAATHKQLGEPLVRQGGQIYSAQFSPDGKRILTAGQDEVARIWDLATKKQVGEPLAGHNGFIPWITAAYSPDGRLIATASADTTIRIWDAATGRQIGAPLRGHQSYVYTARFSPDSEFIVSASWDRTARIWSLRQGAQVRQFDLPDQADEATFSPDGKFIATAMHGRHIIQIWPAAAPLQLASRAHAVAPRCLTLEQRREFFLPAEPPDWCIDMGKWPYQSQSWKDWLEFKLAEANPPLPNTAEWRAWIAARSPSASKSLSDAQNGGVSAPSQR